MTLPDPYHEPLIPPSTSSRFPMKKPSFAGSDYLTIEMTGAHEAPATPLRAELLKPTHRNLSAAELYELAVRRGEGMVASTGALAMRTGNHTGRSAADKFIVRDATTDGNVWWDNNKALSPEHFDVLLEDFLAHAGQRELIRQDLYAGADPAHRLRARIYTEFAWHALFIRHLLIVPPAAELAGFEPQFTVINLPSFRADPKRHGCRSETVIACDFTRKTRADRRHVLCGRDEEIGVHLSELRAAGARRHADALLGQRGAWRRKRRDILRPFRHRQDDAFRRSGAHADRR